MISLLTLRLTAVALLLGPMLAATAALADGNSEILARWRGGQLTAATFAKFYDRDGELRRGGGETLRIRICKASYTEIYHPRALASGLDREADFLDMMERWRERRLAALYRRHHLPTLAEEIPDEAARADYESRPEAFTTPGEADFEMLFVRCGEDREACHARMATHQQRIAEGTELSEILTEERARSGEANGTFHKVALSDLARELRDALTAAATGSLTPLIETPVGLYRARVLRRRAPMLLPLARVAPQIRRRLGRERLAELQAEAVADLRRRLAAMVPEDADENTLLVAAARHKGLDHEPAFAAEEADFKRFALADRAFYSDAEIQPADEQLARRLAAPETAARYREQQWLLAVTQVLDDRYATLRAARGTAAELAAAPDAAGFLRDLAERDARFHVQQLGPYRIRNLRREHPALYELAAELEPGRFKGPFAYRGDPGADGKAGSGGLAFLLLESVRDASLDEVRDELLKDFRGRMAGDLDVFLATFGRRWDFEVLASLEPAPATAASDGPVE